MVKQSPASVLVSVDFGQSSPEEELQELTLLVQSAGAHVVGRYLVKRRAPQPALFIGSGKVQEIAQACATAQAELVVFNHSLSPAQQRNLERSMNLRVLDRTGLILDIFALRAQSFEGKLQVELAQLQYLSSRLVGRHVGLSGQQGGMGMRGPGETRLETDRRLVAARITQLKTRLKKITKQRKTQQKRRQRSGQFTVAVVGYTNAGKSTLFNALASQEVIAADQLFATLETTSRRVFLAPGLDMVLSDTVGFVRALSHSLIEAFKATLEATVQADLLLHVVDTSSDTRHDQIDEVNNVLSEIHASEIPQLLIWNKIDACGRSAQASVGSDGKISSIFLSARTGEGLDLLRSALIEQGLSHKRNLCSFEQSDL